MRMHCYSSIVSIAFVSALGACGGSSASDSNNGAVPPASTATSDDAGIAPPAVDAAGAAPPIDHGSPSDTYPAFKPDVPQLRNGGSGGMKAPKIVTITWPGDDNADKLEAFADAIGTTKYWQTITGQYGVGAATSGSTNHIRMTSPPKDKISDQDLDTLVDVNVSGKSAGGFDPDATKWPANDDNSIYMLYIPQSANFQYNGQSVCESSTGGYHTMSQNGVVYGVVPECTRPGISVLDDTTQSASHEIAESALDPDTISGWIGLDTNHYIWETVTDRNDENGDLCEFDDSNFYTETETGFAYAVQRMWSNSSIAAGHNPCVPTTSAVYFNTTPLADLDSIQISTRHSKVASKGIKLAVGETKSFAIGFYSDGPMDAWDISVVESGPYADFLGIAPTSFLALSVDKSSGKNGEKAVVSVTLKSDPGTGASSKLPYFTVESTSHGVTNVMFVGVSTQ